MNDIVKTDITFYQKVGELFYAIAAADKIVRKAEYKALKSLVKELWSQVDSSKDEYESQAVYQMEIVFDWFDYERMDADSCFDNFASYYKEFPKLFTSERKDLILKTSHAIAGAFAGKNKSELILLGKLQLLFNK